MGGKLVELMKHEGLTSSRLAEILGTGASNISHIISGRSKPGYDLLRKILLRFPRINPDWLLLDSETMYRSEEATSKEPIMGDLFTTESATPLHSTVISDEVEASNSSDPINTGDPQPRIASVDFRNLTSPSVQRIIVIYSDKTFESFTPKPE